MQEQAHSGLSGETPDDSNLNTWTVLTLNPSVKHLPQTLCTGLFLLNGSMRESKGDAFISYLLYPVHSKMQTHVVTDTKVKYTCYNKQTNIYTLSGSSIHYLIYNSSSFGSPATCVYNSSLVYSMAGMGVHLLCPFSHSCSPHLEAQVLGTHSSGTMKKIYTEGLLSASFCLKHLHIPFSLLQDEL